MAALWELFVAINGDNSSYKKSIRESTSETEQFATKMDSVATRLSAVGGKMLGALGFSAIGAGALAASNKFQEAAILIQRSTGATEEKLKGLEAAFAGAYKHTAASSTEVATALSILSTRTQATGKDLEDLTLKTIKLAKTQREDVVAIVPLATRAFGDWSIAANQQGKAMDYLRVASQQTGTSVSRIAEQVVYAGAPLRQLGYNFESATALIGKFEKEGVNTELVLGGMKGALQKFAKDGVTDTAKAWQDFITGVSKGSVTLQDVLKEVGAKRGVDLFKAIQEGRFAIDSTVKSYGELANKGGESLESLKSKTTKWTHEIESLVAGHYQVITVIGLTAPAWMKVASVVTPSLTAMVAGLVGSAGVTTAVTATALTYNQKCALMAGATATVNTGLLGVVSTLGVIGLAIGAATGGFTAWKNVQQGYKPDPKKPGSVFGQPGYVFTGFGLTPVMQPKPKAPYVPLDTSTWATGALGGDAPPPPASSGPTVDQLAKDFDVLGLKAGDVREQIAKITAAYQELRAAGKLTGADSIAVTAKLYDLQAQLYNQTHTTTVAQRAAQQATSEGYRNQATAAEKLAEATRKNVAPLVDLGDQFNRTDAYALQFRLNAQVAMDEMARNIKVVNPEWDKFGGTLYKVDGIMRGLGLNSVHALRDIYDEALQAAEAVAVLYAAGQASAGDVTRAAEAVAEAWKRVTDAMEGNTKGANQRIRRDYYDLANDAERSMRGAFEGMERQAARSIVEWKGRWSDPLKDLAKNTAEDMLSVFLKGFFKPIEEELAESAKKVGGLFASIWGGGKKGGGPGTLGSAGGAASGAGGAAGAAGGLMGTIGAVSAAVGAVSSIIGNFQMAGMNKSLDVLVNHSLRTFNEVAQFRIDDWTRETHWFQKFDEFWHEARAGMFGGGGTGGGKGSVLFSNCTFSGTSERAMMAAAFEQAEVAGVFG